MSKSELQNFSRSHCISFDRRSSVSDLRDGIVSHVTSAQCLEKVNTFDWDASPRGCARSLRKYLSTGQSADAACFVVYGLSHCAQSMSLKPLRRVLTHLGVPYDSNDTLSRLRRRLTLYVSRMQKS